MRDDTAGDPTSLATPVDAINAVDVSENAAPEARTVEPEPIAATPFPIDAIDRDYPLHGLAVHLIDQVYSEPSDRAVPIGYFRRGGRLRAKLGVPGPGCDTRWHAILGGGFICADHGFVLDKTAPDREALPSPPSLHDALPYDYAKITSDTPLFNRMPTVEENRALPELVALLKRVSLAMSIKKPEPVKKAPAKTTAKGGAQKNGKHLESKPKPPLGPKFPEFVKMLMQPGFYVSVDGHDEVGGGALLRTVRGQWASARGELDVHASSLHGVVLDHGLNGLAFVYRGGLPSFTRDPMTGAVARGVNLHTLEPLSLTDEVVRDRGREFRVARDGRLVPIDALRIVPVTPRPPFIPPGSRYIAVSLSTQSLVAYEGNTAVFATLVSTGKPEHETPTGIFRIQQKHVSTTMDGEAGTDEAYSIEDVPWTMYFSGSVALHAAFWHERFGQTRSHGCVNLAPLDARWLFEWSAPNLPLGFHGVFATRENPGTFVVIAP
jgi:hypothetical protein